MCRKKTMQGCCLICAGFGILSGYAIGSWWLTTCVGLGLVFLGLLMLKGH